MQSLILPAPAKLNLFLHITGRREDGYHLLQTLFQFLDYCDEISLSLRSDGEIHRTNDVEGVAEQNDLVIKAAKLLQQKTNSPLGVDITVIKKLPMGGGLGGGSSDAATVLQGLNKLWGCQLSDNELAELGLQLGADVPIFVHGHAAWAEGVGEQIEAVDLSEPWFIVVCPDVHVSTAEIFSDQGLTRNCKPIRISHFLTGQSINVFEPLVRKKYTEVDDALNWLSQFAESRLTGSGSCIFASFPNKNEALNVLEQLPEKWQGFVTKGKCTSPLKVILKRV